MQTYLFYDLETTGLNKAFDQILHFAAIRTDLHFKEIERYELKVRLNPDVIPSPYAMLTHHMRLHDIAEGISEYEAIKQIHQWMNTPGTISLGYNTLSFDDEFLRFSFYRNLLPPYTHQFANQCSRMDIYPMTVMYYLFKNHTLKWPEKNDKISLKLENLNELNQFVSGRAHHAMVDVEATLALAKQLMTEREMWEYLSGYFNKKIETERLQKLGDDEALMIFGKFGASKYFQSVVLSLGTHLHYKNQTLWLRLDDKDLTSATEETILQFTYTLQKKMGEPGFLLPLKDRYIQYLTPEQFSMIKINKEWLRDNPIIFQKITDHYRNYQYPILPNTDMDASLYLNGFWNYQEESFCKSFLTADPKQKSQMISNTQNPKIRTLALRILGRNFPESLTASQAEEFTAYLSRINNPDTTHPIIDFKGNPRLTPSVALQQIQELREQHQSDHHKLELLTDLETALKAKMTGVPSL